MSNQLKAFIRPSTIKEVFRGYYFIKCCFIFVIVYIKIAVNTYDIVSFALATQIYYNIFILNSGFGNSQHVLCKQCQVTANFRQDYKTSIRVDESILQQFYYSYVLLLCIHPFQKDGPQIHASLML